MNFHYELRKSSCRRPLKILTQWTLRVLEVRRHELVIGRPNVAPCHIWYYFAVGRIHPRTRRAVYRLTDTLAAAIELLAYADIGQVLPETGLNGRPLQ
ncbi:MAG: hypothetical protein ACLRI7_14520 [Ruthenibacterium lactatiformans]